MRIEWNDIERFKRKDLNVDDEVYHDNLLLGWISEIKKPWFEEPHVVMTLASHEAKNFVFKDLGIEGWENIQFVKVPLELKIIRKLQRIGPTLKKFFSWFTTKDDREVI